jgi:hypothetical protein
MPHAEEISISEETVLWRRIPPHSGRVIVDSLTRRLRPASGNFVDAEDELSTHDASKTTVKDILAGHEGFGLVSFTVRDVQALGGQLSVRRDSESPAHVLICGKFQRSQARILAAKCEWVVMPSLKGLAGQERQDCLIFQRPPPKA